MTSVYANAQLIAADILLDPDIKIGNCASGQNDTTPQDERKYGREFAVFTAIEGEMRDECEG